MPADGRWDLTWCLRVKSAVPTISS